MSDTGKHPDYDTYDYWLSGVAFLILLVIAVVIIMVITFI